MAVKSKDELLEMVNALIGDRDDDESLAILEDFSDTFNSWNEVDPATWQARLDEKEAEWRQRYRERFFASDPTPDDSDQEDDVVKKTIEDLFN